MLIAARSGTGMNETEDRNKLNEIVAVKSTQYPAKNLLKLPLLGVMGATQRMHVCNL
jgi:hypothetical protein